MQLLKNINKGSDSMRQYSFLKAIVMSFYSKDLYRDVKLNWGGSAILYLLLLLTVTWIPLITIMQTQVNKNAPGVLTTFFSQMPKTDIKNGIVQTPENKPYFFSDPETKKVFGVIDTSGEFTTLKDDMVFLVTKNQIFTNSKHHETKIFTLSSSTNYVIDPVVYKAKILKVIQWLWLAVFPIVILGSFIYRLIQTFFYAIFGKIFALTSGIHLGYMKIYTLTLVALTPVILFETVIELAGVSFPLHWVVNFILAMAYLLFAVRANKVDTSAVII
jgi:hypothetical protein